MFEQVALVKTQAMLQRTNQPFASVGIPGVELSEVLVGDDTLILTANNTSTEALLLAIEAISSEYGLHLNRIKCGDEVPIEHKAEFFGISMNAKADLGIE